MLRMARLNAPGVLHHIIIRGIERRKIFHFYEMKCLGYEKKVENRVCEIFKIESDYMYSASREKIRAEASGLFCYWAVREVGYELTDLAKRLGMTQPGVEYAVNRGENIARKNNYRLED